MTSSNITPATQDVPDVCGEECEEYSYTDVCRDRPELDNLMRLDAAGLTLGVTSWLYGRVYSSRMDYGFYQSHTAMLRLLEQKSWGDFFGECHVGPGSVWRLEQDFVDRHRAGSFVPVPSTLLSSIVPLSEQDENRKQSSKGWHPTQLGARQPHR